MATIHAEEALRKAQGSISERNQKRVRELPPEMLELAKAKQYRIYNVGPKHHVRLLGSLGPWLVQACKPGQSYSEPTVIDAFVSETYATEVDEMGQRQNSGFTLAQDIVGVGPYQRPDNSWERYGVFIAAGERPTKDEIAKAHAARTGYLQELVLQADGYWLQGPLEVINITDIHREAARELNQDKEWCATPKPMNVCPHCGGAVHPGAAVHFGKDGCQQVLDEAKVIAQKLRGFEHLWKVDVK